MTYGPYLCYIMLCCIVVLKGWRNCWVFAYGLLCVVRDLHVSIIQFISSHQFSGGGHVRSVSPP
jgi:hypothetical protein